jgi:hypothetical protein
MAKIALTAKRVERLLKTPGRYRDENVKGLLLVVVGERNASWQLRYEFGGRERWMGFGSLADFSLKEARERARAARQQLAVGIDPLEQRKSEKAARALAAAATITFRRAAEA